MDIQKGFMNIQNWITNITIRKQNIPKYYLQYLDNIFHSNLPWEYEH